MLLAPGPIPPLYDSATPPQPVNPGFSDLVAADTAPLDGIEAAMDALLAVDAVIDALPPDDGIDPILNGVDSDLGGFITYDFDGAAQQLDVSQLSSVQDIVNVYEAIPGEAWQPVPDPQNYGAAGGVPSSATDLTVTIVNLTRPGASDFYPGDQYQITANVSPSATGAGDLSGVEVWLDLVLDGQGVPFGDLGQTNVQGVIQCQGYFQGQDVGDWSGAAFGSTPAGLTLDGPIIDWTVSPLPAGQASALPPGQQFADPGLHPTCTQGQPAGGVAPTVDLVNTTPGSPTAFQLGDTWTLYVTGAPNQDVLIWATLDGLPLGKVKIGTTDDTGNFVLSGAFDQPAYLGVWQEFYQVGTTVVAVTLFFTVSAVPPASDVAQSPPAATSSAPGGQTATPVTPGTEAPTTVEPVQTVPALQPGGIFG